MAGFELTQVALIAGAAALGGLVLHQLRQPILVGYVLAGVLLGPSVLGLAADRGAIAGLAELGVLMLLFLIGLELSLRSFKRVWHVSLITALLQIGVALVLAWGVGRVLGWSPGLAVLVGFAVALSSTAVALKILEDIGELRTDVGRTAIGVLIAQDLAVVPMLLIAGMFSGEDQTLALELGKLGAAIAVLAAVIIVLSGRRRIRIALLDRLEDNEELAAITALAICFSAATLSGLVGLSPAYGAFLAGLVVGNTAERPKMVAATRPIQSALLMVFFLSVGLLLDLRFIWDNLGTVALLVLVVTVGKTAANIAILRLVGEPWPRASLAGTVMGQIGEFSFVLAAAGVAAGLIGADDYRLLVAVIALSLVASPLWLLTARRLEALAWNEGAGARFGLDSLYGAESRAVWRALRAAGRALRAAGRGARATATGATTQTLSEHPGAANDEARAVEPSQVRKFSGTENS
jgi:CPA2 family monovalent cation:H+ antiporter-2